MEIYIISGLAAPVRSLGGEAGSARSPPSVFSVLVSCSCPPGDIRDTALSCMPQARYTVAPCASQDLHGPKGTTMFGSLEEPLGPTALLRRQTKTSSYLVLLSGAGMSCHQAGEDCGTAAGPGLMLRLLVDVLSTSTTSLRPGPTCWAWIRMASVCEPKAGLRPCPKLSLTRAWQDHCDLSSRKMAPR